MILLTRPGNTEENGLGIYVRDWGSTRLTIGEVDSDGSPIAKTVVIDITTPVVEVFGDGHQIVNGGGCANIWDFRASSGSLRRSSTFPP